MLKIILLILVIAVAVILFLASRQPNEFRVSRAITIKAPADAVFPYLNNLKKGQEWSPWFEMEPDAKNTFEGPAEGVGAINAWEGKKLGSGRMTIIESKPNELVRSRLEFLKPMKATNTADFALASSDNATTVTWSMYGQNNLLAKVFSLFMDCEKMVGPQFEKGLHNLKTLVEKQ